VPGRFQALAASVGLVPILTTGAKLVLGLAVGSGSVPGFKDGMLMLDCLVIETEMIISCARRYWASRKTL